MSKLLEAGSEASRVTREDIRTGLDPETLCHAVRDHLYFFQGRHAKTATRNDHYLAVAYAVRDRLFQRGVQSLDLLLQHPETRVVAYLSAEFLMGPQLAPNLVNLGIYDPMREALARMDIRLDDLIDHEQSRAWQRWPRTPGGVLPRLIGDAGSARSRLRHSLRVRHFQSADPGWVAG